VAIRAHLIVGLACLLLAAFLSLGVSACLQTEEQRKQDLRASANELLPSGAHVLDIGYGDCVELAESPSCVQVVFTLPERDSAARAALVREEASRNGWTVTHSSDAPGGWSVFAKRNGSTAVAFLWRAEAYQVDCDNNPDPKSEDNDVCFNTLSVTR